MHGLVALLVFLGQPFWESKPPEKWTDEEVESVLSQSPWVQSAGTDPAVNLYFATAAPIEQAEVELRRRSRKPLPEPDPDYADYLRENHEDAFVLAVTCGSIPLAVLAEENKRMEESSEMKIGRKTYKILGHFPPTASDPVLRLVFTRMVKPTDKTVEFKIYIPGIPFPDRTVTFYVKDLLYHGKLEM